jgi:ethanolamine utilization protein EutN
LILGQVVGSLWAVQQDEGFHARSLKLVVPQDARSGSVAGNTVVAVDSVGARTGDTVIIVYEGSSTRMVLGSDTTPAEAVIVGIVDQMDIVGGDGGH